MQLICNSLTKPLGFDYFLYARYFDDGTLYTLTSDPQIYQYHFEHRYNLLPEINMGSRNKINHFCLPDTSNDKYNQAIYDLKNIFNIICPFLMLEKYDGYTDIYFYSHSDIDTAKCVNFYMNNIEFLEKFKFYFKDKAKKIIAKSNENKIIVPDSMRPNLKKQTNDSLLTDDIQCSSINPKKYFFENGNKHVSLSPRELGILKYISRGYTNKEIAKTLALSPRTIETYQNTIRLKFKIKNKRDLITIFMNSGLSSNI